jgi:site-specific recombinase XerD
MTCVTRKFGNRHTARHYQRETPALESAGQNRHTDSLHTASAERSHTFAANVAASGATLDEIRDLLGHSSFTASEVYLHPSPGRLREAVDRVPVPRDGAEGILR